jgi:hypothetical protein
VHDVRSQPKTLTEAIDRINRIFDEAGRFGEVGGLTWQVKGDRERMSFAEFNGRA